MAVRARLGKEQQVGATAQSLTACACVRTCRWGGPAFMFRRKVAADTNWADCSS